MSVLSNIVFCCSSPKLVIILFNNTDSVFFSFFPLHVISHARDCVRECVCVKVWSECFWVCVCVSLFISGLPFQKVVKPSGKCFRKFVNRYTTWGRSSGWLDEKGEFVSMFAWFCLLFPVPTKKKPNRFVVCDEKQLTNHLIRRGSVSFVCVFGMAASFKKDSVYTLIIPHFLNVCVCVFVREWAALTEFSKFSRPAAISSYLNTRKIISKNEICYTNKRYSLWMYNIIFSCFFNISFPYDINKLP